MKAAAVELPERVPWATFVRGWRWEQGEHVAIVGPTGTGKTTLAHAILPLRRYVAILATKPRDPVLTKIAGRNARPRYRRMREWRPRPNEERVILWPPYERPGDEIQQARVIRAGIEGAFRDSGWTLYVDEARYLSDHLGLRRTLTALWTQGRSLDLTVVAGTQRPAWVPREIYDQSTHLFLFRDRSRENLRRLADLGGTDAELLRAVVPRLGPHEVIYTNAVTGVTVRTEAPRT